MRDATYFTQPIHEWQRRYEALRASFVDRLPPESSRTASAIQPGYVHLLRHQFTTARSTSPNPFRKARPARCRVDAEIRRKIRAWREKGLSAGEIAQLLPKTGWTSPSARSSGCWPKRASPSFPVAPA